MAKSEIIKQMAKGKLDTETALRQLKLLLADFPKKNISSWVDKELVGYNADDILPPYRMTTGTLVGTVLNYRVKASNIGIPLSYNAPDYLKKFCNDVDIRESIGVLKELQKEDSISITVPPNLYPQILKYSLVSITSILGAEVRIGSTVVPRIFSEVDNKILNILILLEKEFGKIDDLDIDINSKTDAEIELIQNNINIYIYNDKSVTIGNDNNIKNSDIISE